MDHNRRKFDNMTDHDLLIAHTVKIDTLCKLVRSNNKQFATFSDRFERQLETYATKLDQRCVHIHDGITDTHKEIFAKVDKKVDGTTFRWVVGIIVLVILSMVGVIGNDLVNSRAGGKPAAPIEYKINDMRGAPHAGL